MPKIRHSCSSFMLTLKTQDFLIDVSKGIFNPFLMIHKIHSVNVFDQVVFFP